MLTFANGLVGLGICLVFGWKFLDLSVLEAMACVLASNVAAFVGLILTLQAEWIGWIKKHILFHPLMSWGLLAIIYFGGILLSVPHLRSLKALLILTIPMIWSNGIMIVVFGPVQDRIFAASQRRARTQAEDANAAFGRTV
jgi:hypothetical protein